MLPPSFLSAKRNLTCTHGALRLSLRPADGGASDEFWVRVTGCDKDKPFERGLVILPGTVLRVCHGKKACFVTVRFFEQKIQYGRFCASGRLVLEN